VVTGIGAASPFGLTGARLWEGLLAGRPAIRPITLFDPTGFRATLAAEVPGLDAASRVSRRRPRADRLALAAADEAVRDSGLRAAELAPAAVVVGGIGGGMLEAEAWYWAREREGADDPRLRRSLLTIMPTDQTELLARRYRTTGPKETVILACSSGGAALGLAADLVRAGAAPVALAGGVDALTRICFMGFNALRLLDPEPCRPFARDRRGMSLGEGAGFVVLEDAAHARARGARAYAELAGHGLTTDAHHLTSPHPDAEGSVRAMLEALDAAGLPPSAVGYVNAHGTGTVQNDRAEALALRKVFDPEAVLVSASKSLIGHAMAAAGALEAVATVLALVTGTIPPTAGPVEPDPEVAFDCVWAVPRQAAVEAAMSNSFGFGGQNVSLVFRRVPAPRGLHG
jgi:3-oxoacyl-[acyl-carrier-protein] synthase II